MLLHLYSNMRNEKLLSQVWLICEMHISLCVKFIFSTPPYSKCGLLQYVLVHSCVFKFIKDMVLELVYKIMFSACSLIFKRKTEKDPLNALRNQQDRVRTDELCFAIKLKTTIDCFP